MPIRIVIADELFFFRAAMRALLVSQPGLVVEGDVGIYDELADAVQRLQPDVVIMVLSGGSGFSNATIETLVKQNKSLRVIAMSPRDEPQFARLLVANGAVGFVSLRSGAEELFKAIHEVFAGRTHVDSSVAGRADKETLVRMKPGVSSGLHRQALLSKRETEVLKLLAQGFTNQQVADTLGLSVKTAETYRVRLTRKLGVKSRSELFRYAFDIGMVGPDQFDAAD